MLYRNYANCDTFLNDRLAFFFLLATSKRLPCLENTY